MSTPTASCPTILISSRFWSASARVMEYRSLVSWESTSWTILGLFSPSGEKEPALACILRGFRPAVHLLIGHPGYRPLEDDGLVHFEPRHVQPLGVGGLRLAETMAYTSPRIKRLGDELGIKLISYREFCSWGDGKP